jgi:hypothetical protein
VPTLRNCRAVHPPVHGRLSSPLPGQPPSRRHAAWWSNRARASLPILRDQPLPSTAESTVMDLVTLVAACALTVDPKLMHALIWQQSGGEPWSFSVLGERQPQVYRSAREVVHEAHFACPTGVPIRVGLTGLATDSASATLAMFMPCLNISTAARRITQLVDRCKTVPRFMANPVRCAIAAYRGSWDHPTTSWRMPYRRRSRRATRRTSTCQTRRTTDRVTLRLRLLSPVSTLSTTSPVTPDDQQQGWSSALFPAKSHQFDRLSTSTNTIGRGADRLQESRELIAHPTTPGLRDDGLLVRRLPKRRPQ